MESLAHTKKTLSAYKGHLSRSLRAYDALLKVQPSPTYGSLEKAYHRVQKQLDSCFSTTDELITILEGLEISDGSVDVPNEMKDATDYYEKLLKEQIEIEGKFVESKAAIAQPNQVQSPTHTVTESPSLPQPGKPTVRLTALEPPSWNGSKADFYTWQRRFVHIMEEAMIEDELTQLCYLQNKKTLPPEYQALISDCSSLNEVWSRLEERVPKETIKFEILLQFRNLRPLTSRKTPTVLRDFANEISLFCRRMDDIGIKRENYSCIILQDVYDRLDQETVLRYRSKVELKREILIEHHMTGVEASSMEGLDSLCKFIRAEATTLELSMGNGSQPEKNSCLSQKAMNVAQKVETVSKSETIAPNDQNGFQKCALGCQYSHRLIECPLYMKFPVQQRKNFVKDSSRCYACLSTQHHSRNCLRKKTVKCKLCSDESHHWTLCFKQQLPNTFGDDTLPAVELPGRNVRAPTFDPQRNQTKQVNQIKTAGPKEESFSPMVVAEVKTQAGGWIKANLFLDMGSNASLIRNNFAERIKLRNCGTSQVDMSVAGGGSHKEEGTEFVVTARALNDDGEGYPILATGIDKPCAPVQSISSDLFIRHRHLRDYQDSVHIAGGQIDILVGSDYAPLITPERCITAPNNRDQSPSIACTRLGLYIYGGLSNPLRRAMNNVNSVNAVSVTRRRETDQLRNFFYNDIIGVKPTSLCVCSDNEIAESAFIKHVEKTTRINEEGRVEVSMPWRPGFPVKLPNNFSLAMEQMIRKRNQCMRNGKLGAYNRLVQDLIERGVVRILTEEESLTAATEPAWYLSHHMVERPDKDRLVFNSALPYHGVCLNDALEKGPDYTNSLFRVLLKWRSYAIALSGDMVKMFNQIATCPADRPYHRFLWCFEDGSPILIMEWSRVLFGDKPSPDLAGYAIRYLAELSKGEHPRGAQLLKDSTYVDDVGFSTESVSEASRGRDEVVSVLKRGQFSIKCWNSNCLEIDGNRRELLVDFLGHTWDKREDLIGLKTRKWESGVFEFTKRTLMGQVARFWDPCGLLLPVTIRYRISLQKLWQEGYSWDGKVSCEHITVWQKHLVEMENLSRLSVPRCLKPEGATTAPQLHGFSDGGDDAFGACVFLRWVTPRGVEIKLVAAKAFVAPLKHKTTPRLELMGAVALGRLMLEVTSALPYEIESKSFWIDSEVVLHWINSVSSRYKPFVSSRIQEFQDTHPHWEREVRFVPGTENPADCLTKPISLDKLLPWHQGEYCQFLKTPESEWPNRTSVPNVISIKAFLEEKPVKHKTLSKPKKDSRIRASAVNSVQVNQFTEAGAMTREGDIQTWLQLKRAVAFLKRALKSKSFRVPLEPEPADLRNAEKCIFRICQQGMRMDLSSTKRKFLKLDPIFDEEGVIRANGRLGKTELSEEEKHPVILPGEHPWVRLLAVFHHKRLLHQGYRVVLIDLVNSGLVIGRGRDLLRSVANSCLFCRTRRRLLLQQQMGTLPSFRVKVHQAPFASVALDFFGNLMIKQSRNVSVKGSVLIVTCMTTRCIHLELCTTIDTDSFIRAWRRFTSVRGVHPNHVFSDGAGAFKSANKLLTDWISSWDTGLIGRNFQATTFVFQWEYNVPLASHMNGVVESLIGSIRKGLDAAITNYTKNKLVFEDWSTVLYEITYIINSRPLYPDGDPELFKCITANDILHPHGQPSVPQFTLDDVENMRGMLRNVQGKISAFWDSWQRHMPPQLNNRNKWFHPRTNLGKGDFVLIFEPGMKNKAAPRSLWKKGIVDDVHPGTDGLVRSATIRDSKHNTYVRPVSKLCLIATRAELEGNQTGSIVQNFV